MTETLLHYLKDEALEKIPVWQMISATPEQLQARAQHWLVQIGSGQLMAGLSTVGGGSLPEETLPTTLYALDDRQPNSLLARLRCSTPPVIARVEENRVVFDPRTVLPDQDEPLIDAILRIKQQTKP